MTRETLKATKSAYYSNKDTRKLGSYGLTLMTMLNFCLKDLKDGRDTLGAIEDLAFSLKLAKTYDNTCCKGKYKHELNKGICNLAYLRNLGNLPEGGLNDIKLAVAIHEEQLLAMTVAGFMQTLSVTTKTKENNA